MKKNNIEPFCEDLDENIFNSVLDYMQKMNLIVLDTSSSNEDIVYLKPLYVIEENSSSLIRNINIRRIPPLNPSVYDDFFKEYTKKTGIEADDIQKLAVKVCYENRLSVLTGGPGTGKTQTINAKGL